LAYSGKNCFRKETSPPLQREQQVFNLPQFPDSENYYSGSYPCLDVNTLKKMVIRDPFRIIRIRPEAFKLKSDYYDPPSWSRDVMASSLLQQPLVTPDLGYYISMKISFPHIIMLF
jgi:hypothetical protein